MTFNVEELKKKAISLGQTGLNMAQNGVDKSVQLASVAKLKALNVKEESNLRAAYVELGKMYFSDHGAEPEAAYAAVCSQIADIQAAIAANNAKIAEIKVTPDVEIEIEVEETAEEPEESAAQEEAAPVEAPAEETPVKEEDGEYGFTD